MRAEFIPGLLKSLKIRALASYCKMSDRKKIFGGFLVLITRYRCSKFYKLLILMSNYANNSSLLILTSSIVILRYKML